MSFIRLIIFQCETSNALINKRIYYSENEQQYSNSAAAYPSRELAYIQWENFKLSDSIEGVFKMWRRLGTSLGGKNERKFSNAARNFLLHSYTRSADAKRDISGNRLDCQGRLRLDSFAKKICFFFAAYAALPRCFAFGAHTSERRL